MSRVLGVDRFASAMSSHAGEYVLIGGGACSILFDRAGQSFRATDDLDIVILTDKCDPSFARDFWSFVSAGSYRCGKRDEGRCSYYRFRLPQDSEVRFSLPAQIELFARHPDFILEDESSEIAPLPFDETVSSLSAIILDDGYYEFIRDNVVPVDGVPILSAIHIIPLKMRAHVDINDKYEQGRHCNERDLRKHRRDVAQLSGLLTQTSRLMLGGQMREDAERFFVDFERYALKETNRKKRAVLQEDLKLLRSVYL
ncbi:hypothetical protein [uncultured Adlercreutzia sp.]|uniref:hypothetical protein n=1 Tax=uncultured Adlercreutzia sp. TaxID=875803 RepID=UPI0026F3F4F6|nr:hypothetical protein [uncultured Adlercreutzia sp.]